MRKFSKKPFYFEIFLNGILLFSFLFLDFYYIPKKINQTLSNYKETKKEIQKIKLIQKKLPQFKKEIQKIKNEISPLKSAFIETKEKDLVNFIASLEKKAKDLNLSFKITNLEEEKKENFYLMHFKLEGDFQNTFRFIKCLENTPDKVFRLIRIKKIILRKNEKKEKSENEKEKEKIVYYIQGEFEIEIFKK